VIIFTEKIDAKKVLREIKIMKHFNQENMLNLENLMFEEYKDFGFIYLVFPLLDSDLYRIIKSK